jgi:hypothetical protein
VDSGTSTFAGGVLGFAHDGVVEYAPADVARGAVALLDMASRHPDDPDAAGWARSARASLDHLSMRARDARSGLFYARLVTDPASAADHPVLAEASSAEDFVTSDDQASIALALARAGAIVATLPGSLAAGFACAAYTDRAQAILVAMGTSPSLWDDTGHGYMAGLRLSTAAITTDKTTLANAYALAALYKIEIVRVGPEANHGAPLRNVLLAGTPPNSSLFSVIPDQNAYFAVTSQTFDFPDDAGLSVDRTYSTRASLAVCEGLSELWPNP